MIENVASILVFILTFFFTRIVLLIHRIRRNRISHVILLNPILPAPSANNGRTTRTMIVAGSGGHTSEMMKLVGQLSDTSYNPRHYIVADTDIMSIEKIKSLEKLKMSDTSEFKITFIPRSREVMQSWLTTLLSSAKAFVYSTFVVLRFRPDLVLCNGPGTCVPLCLAAFLATVLGLKRIKIVFVESLCRVFSMSLTGRILYQFADHIVVQWPELQQQYPLSTYLGRIV